jgi:hypothetical protein
MRPGDEMRQTGALALCLGNWAGPAKALVYARKSDLNISVGNSSVKSTKA